MYTKQTFLPKLKKGSIGLYLKETPAHLNIAMFLRITVLKNTYK